MKSKQTVLIIGMIALSITAAGCSSAGMFAAGNITDVQLRSGNYKIMARGVSGESVAGYILGLSASVGMQTRTFAVARVEGTGMLYKEALDNLWKNYEAEHGAAEGNKLALINVHYDTDVLNLFVYTQTKVMVRADVIEFGE